MNHSRQQQFKAKFPVKLLGFVFLIGLIVVLMFIYGGINYFRADTIKTVLMEHAQWAPLLIIFLNAIRPFTLVPASVLSIPAGAVFGVLAGGVYTMIGQVLAALVAFGAARYFARDYVEKTLYNKLKNKRELLEQIQKQAGFKTIVFLRLLPILPFDLVSYGAGLSEIKLREYLLATITAVIPGSLIYNYFGSTLLDWRSGRFLLPLTVIVLMTAGSSGYYYFKWVRKKKQKVS